MVHSSARPARSGSLRERRGGRWQKFLGRILSRAARSGTPTRRGTAGVVITALAAAMLSGGVVLTSTVPASAATVETGTIYGLDWNTPGTRWLWAISNTGNNTHLLPLTQVAAHPWGITNALAVNTAAGEFYFASQTPNAATIPIYRVDGAAETTEWIADIPMGPLTGVNHQGAFNGVYDAVNGIYYLGVQSGSTGYVYGYDVASNTALGVVATIPVPAGDNNIADFAIDSTGRLYYVTDHTAGTRPSSLLVTDQPLPTSGSSIPPALTATTIAVGTTPQPSSGAVAFGSDGYLYSAGVSNDRMDRMDPTTGEIANSYIYSDPTAQIADFASDAIPNTIEVVKDLPSGRAAPTDQFGLSITGGGATSGNTGTTTGTENGVQNQAPSEQAGPIVALVGTTFTVGESASGTTDLADYTSTWSCVNANANNAVVASGSGTGGEVTVPSTGLSGTHLICTMTNDPILNDLVVEKTSTATADTHQGDEVTYTVRATNPGPAAYTAANPAVLVDDLSGVLDDATFGEDASADQPGATSYTEPLLSWTGALAAGASVELTYTVTLDGAGDGQVRNVAWEPNDPGTPVTPACDPPIDGVDPGTGEPCATVEYPLPRLSIAKSTDRTDLPAVGEDLTYTVVVTNEGPGAYTATAPATATDDLAEVLDDATFDDSSLTATAGTATRTGDTLEWSGPLDAGESATITYSVTYTGDGDSQLTNNVCVTPADTAPGASPCDSVTTPGAGLQQWKSAVASSDPVVAGSTISYTLFFDNDGQTPASVDAVDDLSLVLDDATVTTEPTSPDGLTVVRDGAQISLTGSVPVGQVYTATYTVTVLPDEERGDSVATNFLLAPGESPPPDGMCDPVDPDAPDCTSTPITGVTYAKSVEASETPAREGTELTYSVTMTNTGATNVDIARDDDLSDVLDDATLTDGPDSDTGSVTVDGPAGDLLEIRGTLPAGETAVVTYTVVIEAAADRGNSRADNFLVEPGTTPPDDCDPATAQCTSTLIQGYTVAKTVDVSTATPGDVATYTVTLVNTGGSAFTAGAPATFTDDLSEVLDDATYNGDVSSGGAVAGTELSWAGPLAVGATVTVTYSVTVNDPRTGDGTMTNVVVPTSPGGDCSTDGQCRTETPIASYIVAKTADVSSAFPGDVVTYTVTVTNTGEAPYTDAAPAAFSDDLSEVLDDATYDGSPSPGVVITGSTLSWTGPLDVGATVSVSYSVTVNEPATGDQELLNSVVPSAPGGGCDQDASCATSTPVGSYTVSKVADQSTALPGGIVTYTVTVTNTGDVDYTDTVPATFTDALAAVLDDAVYNDDASSGATVTGSMLTWSGALAAGESIAVTYSVTVDDPVTGDFVLRNVVTPTGPGGACDADCETTTSIGSFRVVKSTESTEVVPGDVVEYSITVTNTGQVAYTDATPAAFSDSLSAVLDDATYNGDGTSSTGSGLTYAAPTLAWSGALGVGETVTITYSVTVNDPATGDRQLDNAVVTPPDTGGNCEPGSTDPACTANVPAGTYTVAKSVSTSSALPGDTVTYTLTVTNTGQVAFTDDEPASFSDDLSRVLDDASYNEDVSPGGSVSDGTLTWAGAIAVGGTVRVTYSVTVDDPVTGDFSLRNTVTPTSPGGECLEGDCTTITPVAGYTVQKTSDAPDTQGVHVGDVVTYSLTVTNVGGVAYTDADLATFEDDMSGVLDDATYNDDATAGATLSDGLLTWAAPLDIGASVTITYSVTVNDPDTGDKSLRNTVFAGTPGGGCATADGCATVTPVASYAVAKTVSSSLAAVGDRVTYTITVTNTGDVPYTQDAPASFTDDLSSALRIAAYNGDASAGAVYDHPMLSWQGAVGVGEVVTVTYSVTLREVGEIRNVVVTPDDSGANCPTASEDPGCQTVTTVVPPGLAVTGGALWVGGIVGAAALLTLGLWLVARRRREDADMTAHA